MKKNWHNLSGRKSGNADQQPNKKAFSISPFLGIYLKYIIRGKNVQDNITYYIKKGNNLNVQLCVNASVQCGM